MLQRKRMENSFERNRKRIVTFAIALPTDRMDGGIMRFGFKVMKFCASPEKAQNDRRKKAMKKLIACLVAAILSIGLFACAAPVEPVQATPEDAAATALPEATDSSEEIVFNDDVLEGLVREAMKKPEGAITAADAAAVTELDMQMQGVDPDQPYIHNLDALKYFVNLTYLGMGYAVQNADDPNGIVDISPLAGLTKLESLQLGGLVIADLSPVSGMTHLKSLTVFGGKKLSDLSPLANLAELQALTLNNNAISDVTPLAGLTNLIYLDLQANQITDVSALAGLTNLQRLFLENNPVADYSPLRQIRANLEEWDFDVPAES